MSRSHGTEVAVADSVLLGAAADLVEYPRGRIGLTLSAIAPALNASVRSNAASLQRGRRHLEELPTRRGGLKNAVVSPACDRAVDPDGAGESLWGYADAAEVSTGRCQTLARIVVVVAAETAVGFYPADIRQAILVCADADLVEATGQRIKWSVAHTDDPAVCMEAAG
jgi:hypothetical protein